VISAVGGHLRCLRVEPSEVAFGTNNVVECIIRKTREERLIVKGALELFGKACQDGASRLCSICKL
jgi:hypothetical protein